MKNFYFRSIFMTNKCFYRFILEFGLIILLSLCFFNCAFSFSSNQMENELRIISWNLQTFFDPITEGTEYEEFQNSNKWNTEKYQDRLNLLCDFIEKQDADIYAFTELENKNIMQDISNNLSTRGIFGTKYKYACFGKNPNGVFGCGVISKYPLENVKLHNVDFSSEQPELRPLLEVTAYGKDQKPLSLFLCHWKSKSGGEAETELWRDLQEGLLASSIEKAENQHILVCGDFNRDLNEFFFNNSKDRILLRNFNKNKLSSIQLVNPWIFSNEKGSYNFNEEWNKIDHFFLSENINLLDFHTIKDFTNEEGLPVKYSVRNGKGYSDHLPIVCLISF